jgi:two-component system NtrC family sensor kinase
MTMDHPHQISIDELRAERDAALAREAALVEVLDIINRSPGNPQPVFEAILEKAHSLCGAAMGALATFDDRHFRAVATRGCPAKHDAVIRQPFPPNVYHQALLRAERLSHLEDVRTGEFEDNPITRSVIENTDMRTNLTVPLRKDGVLLGLISAWRRQVRAFSEKEITLLENLAAQAVIAMENARLLGELQQRTDELAQRNSEYGERIEQQAATIDVLKVMSSSPDDVQPVFDLIVRRAAELCESRVGLFEFDGTLFHLRAMHGFTPEVVAKFSQLFPAPLDRTGSHTYDRAVMERRVIHVPHVSSDPLIANTAGTRMLEGTSIVTIPLSRDGDPIGVIGLNGSPAGGNGFSDSQIALLQTFAEQAVIAIGSVANFRALRQRTAELAQRQAELRVTFENMGDGVAMFDETRSLVAWNRKFQDMLDGPDAVMEEHLTVEDYIRYLTDRGEFGPEADPVAQLDRLRSIGTQPASFERTRPNGRIIELRVNPVEGGGFVLIYADITARKRAESEIAAARDAAEEAARTIETAYRELKVAQANLIQAEKMASLGQLTAGIAHEIKNPLNFVNNFANLSLELLGELKEIAAPALTALDEAKRAEADEVIALLTSNLAKITEHGQRADGIVRSMLEHSRGSAGERRSVDANALVEDALNLAYHGARAQDQSFNITLEREFAAGLAPVTLTPQDITRVLLNLVSNGFYAVRKRCDAAGGGFEPTLTVTTRELGDAVEIRVRDNGIGIPAEIKDKLFQPFFTTKPTGEGTGLGLSISYDIVTNQHGGTITVDSEPGSFTEFIVTLPREPAPMVVR